MIWRYVKGYRNYKISNTGIVLNIKTGKKLKGYVWNGRKMVSLTKNNITKNYTLGRLILKHFTKKPPKFYTVYKNGDLSNCNLKNLKRGTMSEARFIAARHKNKIRGVNKVSHGSRSYFRAYLSLGDGKTKTLGYFKTKKKAVLSHYQAYLKLYGVQPYQLPTQYRTL